MIIIPKNLEISGIRFTIIIDNMNFKYRKFKMGDKKTVTKLMKELFKETSNEIISNKNI